jgi:hypothetical protein
MLHSRFTPRFALAVLLTRHGRRGVRPPAFAQERRLGRRRR